MSDAPTDGASLGALKPLGMRGYQRWTDRQRTRTGGWLAVVRNGLKLSMKDAQARALMYMAGSYVVGACILFYGLAMVEAFAGLPEVQGYTDMISRIVGIDLTGVKDLGTLRPVLWRAVFMLNIKVQIIWIAVTISRLGPGQIADDLKLKALPIYFARPLTPMGYLAGKWAVVASYVALLSLLPNLAVLVFATMLTGGLNSWGATLDLALDLLVAGVGLMVFLGMVMLAISSLATDKRYAAVGWWALCILPVIAQGILRENLAAERLNGWLGSISLYANLAVLIEWLLEIRPMLVSSQLPYQAFQNALLSPVEPIYPAIVLGVITLGAIVLTYRRVVRFSRAAANL
jgi:hypothetical protein